MKDTICAGIGIIGGAIAALFGGWDAALQTLVIFMAIDYITGLIVAGVFHASPKTTSGYRTAAHNASVGGAKSSQHLLGRAADIQVAGTSVEAVAAYAESLMPGWGGVGRYPVKSGRARGWVHVDTRANKSRWTM